MRTNKIKPSQAVLLAQAKKKADSLASKPTADSTYYYGNKEYVSELKALTVHPQFREEINRDAIDNGYEGIMIKDPDAPYECKRSTAWLKLKPFIEVSLTVTAVEEGTGRNVGKLGALVCEGIDDGKGISVNVGSGFTDANRDDYWTSCEEVVGKVVEVRADAITQNQDGSYSLRFPRFIRFRGFKDGEKI